MQKKIKCKRDHDLLGDNLLIDFRGARQCRTCLRKKWRDWSRNNKLKGVLDETL